MAKKKARQTKTKKKPKKVKKVRVKKRQVKKGRAKKVVSKKRKVVEEPLFEEITYRCPGCGRSMRVVKVSGYDVSGTLCQRCAQGEIAMEEEEAAE